MNKVNQVNFFKTKQTKPIGDSFALNSDNDIKSFKDTFVDMVHELNEVTNKPEQLQNDVMLGRADVSDVMAAIAQADMSVQMATTVTGKILQTYEKIMQIQI